MEKDCRYCKGFVELVSGSALFAHRPDLELRRSYDEEMYA